jgi:hypothetical protein
MEGESVKREPEDVLKIRKLLVKGKKKKKKRWFNI